MGTVRNITSIIKLILLIVVIVVALGVVGKFTGLLNKFSNLFGSTLSIEKTENVISEIKKISEFTTACFLEETVLQEKRYKIVEKPVYELHDGMNKRSALKTLIGNGAKTDESKTEAFKTLLGANKTLTGVLKDTIDTGDRLVYTVQGTVRAGYNLSKIGDEGLRISNDTIFLKLPDAEIFDVIVNTSDFKEFDRIGEWSEKEDTALKVKARDQMREDAIKYGILEKAVTAGQKKLESLFLTFGFNAVVIE